MHGTYSKGDDEYRRSRKSSYGGNTVNNTGGTAGRSQPQQPIAGPEDPGPPPSMRKALARKSVPMGSGPGAPNKGVSSPSGKR